MSTTNKPLGRLLFAQGGKCFFCEQQLTPGEASVEHLVAMANGGSNSDENCVACCKALNALLGRMSLKEKLRVALNQKGQFKCPGLSSLLKPTVEPPKPIVESRKAATESSKLVQPEVGADDKLAIVITDLQKRGAARPRTLKTLGGTISALFKKQLTETEVTSLIKSLRAKSIVMVVGSKVTYEI